MWYSTHRQIIFLFPLTHTHTPNHLMALCPGPPRWAGTRKVKPIWILVQQETVSGSGISWAVCKSAPRSRQITMPAPHHSVFYRPDALPAAQPTASKHWRHINFYKNKITINWVVVFVPTYFCIRHQLLFTKIWYRETHSSDEYCIIFSLSSTRAHGKENYAPSIATWVLRESTLNLCHFKHIQYRLDVKQHTHTHTQPFNGALMGLPRWAGTRKKLPTHTHEKEEGFTQKTRSALS